MNSRPTHELEKAKFMAAPAWAREEAFAKRDLILLIEACAKDHNKRQMRQALLVAFNKKFFAKDLAETLSPPSIATYQRWLAAYQKEGMTGLLPIEGKRSSLNPDLRRSLGTQK